MDKIDYIKNNFGTIYIDNGPENGTLYGTKYVGCKTHCRACLYSLTKYFKPKNILEIGSWHYESSISMSRAIVEEEYDGYIFSFDIKRGGYDGYVQCMENLPNNIRPMFWWPYNTSYDDWKYNDEHIVYKDFKNHTNQELCLKNEEIMKSIAPKEGFDLVFLDGDHSYEGVSREFELVKKYTNKDTLFVVDNIWDSRLFEVRQFFDSLPYKKWDFEEWNDENLSMVQDTGVFIV